MTSLLAKIVLRGHRVEISCGKLEIITAAGSSVPPDWFSKNEKPLILEIVTLTDSVGLTYEDFSTGRYGGGKNPGVHLEFLRLDTEEEVHAFFNADLTYQRGSELHNKGDPLPGRRFFVGRRHALYKFWLKTGRKVPKSSRLWEHMGNLKQLVFTGEIVGDRINATTLRPLSVSREEIETALPLVEKSRTTNGQSTDNTRTDITDMGTSRSASEALASHNFEGRQPRQGTTCNTNCETSTQGKKVTTNVVPCTEDDHLEWIEEFDPHNELA